MMYDDHGNLQQVWPYMGKNDQEGRHSQVPSMQEQDRTGGSGMNVQEAIQIAKREMGLTEIPPMTSEKRKVFGRRVYEICQQGKNPVKITKLEEF